MLSLSNVSGQQVSEYYEKDNYYMRDGSEKLGEWQGKLASEYNLPADINKQDFDRLISAKDKRAGTDLTFSAPKSVSLAMHLSPELKEDIFTSHKEAVTQTLSFIESHYTGYRQTDQNGNKIRKHSDNFLAAKFDHLTSRALDPQLHTHCVILNKTLDANGKTWALNNENFFRNEIYLGQMYRNELARLLQEKGYELEITDRKNGFFEIKGFEPEQLEEFSKRAQEISEFVKEKNWNEKDPAARAAATILTRKAKQTCDLDLQKKAWSEQFKDAGISNNQIIKSPERSQKSLTARELENFFSGVDKKISQKTVAFTAAEYSKLALREGLGLGIIQKDIDNHMSHSLKSKNMEKSEFSRLQRTQNGATRVPCTYYGTREAIDLERKVMKRLGSGKEKSYGLNPVIVDNYLKDLKNKNIKLTPGQEEALRHIATSKDMYVAAQGHAGTGKSFMLKHLREMYNSQDTKNKKVLVQGLSFTGQAADNLYKSSGIKSSTIHAYLNYLEKEAGGKIPGENYETKTHWNLDNLKPLPGEHSYLWVVDEASMINNNLMDQLTIAAEKVNAKIVYSGDINQFQAIGAGNAYTQMIEKNKISYTEMREIVRQKEIWNVYSPNKLSEEECNLIRKSAAESKEVTGIDIKIEFINRKLPEKLKELNNSGKIKIEPFSMTTSEKMDSNTNLSITRTVHIHKDNHIQIAVKQAAEGNIRETIRQLGEDTKQIKSKTKRLDKIAGQYSCQNKSGRDNSCILTASNRDRNYINKEVRENLKKSGFLGTGRDFEVLNIYNKQVKIELAEGDKIMFLRTNNHLQVKNGTRGELIEIRGNNLMVKLDDCRLVNVDLEKYNNITHGYAFTSYKAQGMSVDRAFINIDTTQGSLNSRNKFYVDISRVKCEVDIYTDSKPRLYKSVALAQEKLSADIFNKQVIKEKKSITEKPELMKTPDNNLSPARDLSDQVNQLEKKNPEFKRDCSDTVRSILMSAETEISKPDFLKPGYECKCDIDEALKKSPFEKNMFKEIENNININPFDKGIDNDRGGMSM